MQGKKRFLVDVGIKDLPFPMKVISKADPEGQSTIANISISARIMQEFEARSINSFRSSISTETGSGREP